MKKSQEEIEKYYDEYVGRQKHVGVNQRHRSIMEKVLKRGLQSHHNVLEIGCGIGTYTSLLMQHVQQGEIVAMDISPKSIEEAQKTYKQQNLKFLAADATDYDFDNLEFDFIIMPDVIEHIPIELHFQLFEKLSKVLKSNGKVFIHIPNPPYLQWCHENRPDLLQVIDQPITTDVLVKNVLPNGFIIEELKTYSIWIEDGDYQYIVLRKNGYQDFNKNIEYNPSFIDKVKYKLKHLKK